MTGRGWGKTRTAAQHVIEVAQSGKAPRIGLIARTAGELRSTMVEGEAGILACSPPWFYPKYEPSKRRLTWPNGVQAETFSGDKPDQLRGPSHHFVWADELASWRYADEAWSNAMFGLRLGDARALITTTPRPIKVLRELLKMAGVAVTTGTSYENFENLSDNFRENILLYEGTRLGRQELLGQLLEDVPGALWNLSLLDECRVEAVPHGVDIVRLVVAVDPAVTSSEESNETGIVIAARCSNGHAYVFDDLSDRLSPDSWAKRAVGAYHGNHADRIVGEVNQGGDLVEKTIRTVDPHVAYKAVRASKGKIARAEPVSALYEQHKVHHIGSLSKLEDQMCLVAGTLVLTQRGNVPIAHVTTSDFVLTRQGWRRVLWSGCTGMAETVALMTTQGVQLRGTGTHPVWVKGEGFVPLREVTRGCVLESCDHSLSLLGNDTTKITTATSRPAVAEGVACYTATDGKPHMGQSPLGLLSITRISTATTMPLTTLPRYPTRSTGQFTGLRAHGWSQRMSDQQDARRSGRSRRRLTTSAQNAAKYSGRPVTTSLTAPRVVDVLPTTGERELVYNLTVANTPEYFANGLLVHNCTYVPGEADFSPDRMDALVWAITELMLYRQSSGGTSKKRTR